MNTQSLAPVCLFVYKRVDTLKYTIESLLLNELAKDTDLYIFSDAASQADEKEKVREVRSYIKKITGFKSLTLHFSYNNNGLAKSIVNGVTNIINDKGKVIVLEDDLVVTSNFLNFMNEALINYKSNAKVFSISGYSSPISHPNDSDVYFSKRGSSWGWATWKDRWVKIDWEVSDFEQFIQNKYEQSKFNRMGSDLSHMLKKQMAGKINSWAIRWVYHQFKHDLFTVFPMRSKVSNEGFHSVATNTTKSNKSRFSTTLDSSGQQQFNFNEKPELDEDILRQFVTPYTIKTRAIYKLKSLLHI